MSNDEPKGPVTEESERRWIISVAVSSRPDMTVEALTAVLAESGFVVTGRELGADLTALGYEVVDDPDGTATIRALPGVAAAPDPDGTPTVADGAATPAGGAAAAAAAGDGGADAAATDPTYGNILGLPSSDGPTRPLLLIGVGVVVVVAIIVGLIIALGGGDKKDGDTVAGGTTTPPAVTTPGGKATLRKLVPMALPGLAGGTVVRSGFDTDSADSLGKFGTGEWQALNGKWSVQKGKAVMVSPATGVQGTLALAPVQAADLILNLHVPPENTATGLAFRVKDDKNFWMLLVSRKYNTLSLLRVVNGKPSQVSDAGLLQLPRVDLSIGIKAQGNSITGYVVGNAVIQSVDPGGATAGKGFGLAVGTKATKGVFDDVVFKAL